MRNIIIKGTASGTVEIVGGGSKPEQYAAAELKRYLE